MAERGRRWRRAAVITGGVALLAWCGWVSGLRRSTLAADLTWLCSLAAVVAVDMALWRGRRNLRFGWHLEPARAAWPRPGSGALRGTWTWAALASAVLVWEILGIATGPHQPHLTISALTLVYRPLNAATLLVWMLTGIGYGAVRARRPPDAPPPPGDARPVHRHGAVPALLLPADRRAGVAFWIGVAALAVACDVAGRRSGGRLADAEDLLRAVTSSRIAHTAAVLAWTYAGYHLFAH